MGICLGMQLAIVGDFSKYNSKSLRDFIYESNKAGRILFVKTAEAAIVQIADAISSARPGARRESLQSYIKRLEELGKIANAFEGVEKAFAIQAGREVRVIVRPEDIDDLSAEKLSKEIARKIEEEVQYPGQVKVQVIREVRAVEYAK